jgi:hypothetical protein
MPNLLLTLVLVEFTVVAVTLVTAILPPVMFTESESWSDHSTFQELVM